MPKPAAATSSSSIVVKFRDEIQLPYIDALEQSFVKLPELRDAWEALSKLASGCTLNRVFRVFTPENTAKLFDLAAKNNKNLRATSKSLFKYFLFECSPGSDLEPLLRQLLDWKQVEHAYLPPGVAAPPTNGRADTRSHLQFYLEPARRGIDAQYAWLLPGGDGANQEFVDVERGWAVDHFDLRDEAGRNRVQFVGGANDPVFAGHGNGVLGIVCATDHQDPGPADPPRDTGITGIAHNVTDIRVVGHDSTYKSIPRAIEIAILSLLPGIDSTRLGEEGCFDELVSGGLLPTTDKGPVLLLEIQLNGRMGPPDASGRSQTFLLPAEIDPVIFDLIEIATSVGIVVIEAGGDGTRDLDLFEDTYRTPPRGRIFLRNGANPNFLDSGAILVGAADCIIDPVAPLRWTPTGNTSRGTRIDCFAEGSRVYTLSHNDYQALFNSTSSAAAIVAGAAVALQGLAQANRAGNARYTPLEVRVVLGDPTPFDQATKLPVNTPSDDPPNDKIGVMPNLRHAANNWLRIQPPSLPAPAPELVLGPPPPIPVPGLPQPPPGLPSPLPPAPPSPLPPGPSPRGTV